MSFIITLLSSHLLSVLESELVANEPAIVAMITSEIQLLITKLESFIQAKEPALAAVLNPVLATAGSLVNTGVQAGASAIMAQAAVDAA